MKPQKLSNELLDQALSRGAELLKLRITEKRTRLPVGSAYGDALNADGERVFLKVQGLPKESALTRYERKDRAEAGALPLAPRWAPASRGIARWTQGGTSWRATAYEWVDGMISTIPFVHDSPFEPDDAWLRQLVTALHDIAAQPSADFGREPLEIVRAVHGYFGPTAPATAETWTSAHGDLHWGNVTAPALRICDWDRFGLAPRGYDAARLLVHSVTKPRAFAALTPALRPFLQGASGTLALHFAIAEAIGDLSQTGTTEPSKLRELEARMRTAIPLVLS